MKNIDKQINVFDIYSPKLSYVKITSVMAIKKSLTLATKSLEINIIFVDIIDYYFL